MKYIVAVSGGVDSVALLDMLVNDELEFEPGAELVVAHFDHGIREESGSDAEFVAGLAARYGLVFEKGEANLGEGTSEERARQERYNFLRECRKKHEASAIVLAHHRDDQVETAIINLIRGTGWRGLASLDTSDELTRPLLHMTKGELIAYANQHGLAWVEDSTNTDQTYLRNYVRHTVVPRAQKSDSKFSATLLGHIDGIKNVKYEIDHELSVIADRYKVSDTGYKIPRYVIIGWPNEVAGVIVHYILSQLDDDWHPTMQHITRALHFSKTADPGKVLHVSKRLQAVSTQRHLEFKKY